MITWEVESDADEDKSQKAMVNDETDSLWSFFLLTH